MKIRGVSVPAGIAILFLCSTCQAGWFTGGALTYGNASNSYEQYSASEDTIGLKGFAGYRFNSYIGVEASLAYAYSGALPGYYDDFTIFTAAASVIGYIPINPVFHIFAKAGPYTGNSEDSGEPEGNETESGALLGAGFLINLGPLQQFTIRLEFEDYETDNLDDYWTASAGFQYNFGGM